MALVAPRWIGISVIVTLASACDNVGWAGVQYQLTPPPGRDGAPSPDREVAQETREQATLDLAPLLFLAERSGGTTQLLPVAQLGDGELLPLPSTVGDEMASLLAMERMPPGRRFALLYWGERVGTFTAGADWELDSRFCLPRPRRAGRVELLPEASGVQRFLALEEGAVASLPLGEFMDLSSTFDQRVGSLNVATSLIARLGAPWPPAILDIRRDLQIVPMGEGLGSPVASSDPPPLGLSGTFIFGDALSTATPEANAYTLFFLASPEAEGFEARYAWYHRSAPGAKAAPRTLSRISLEGREEWVLELFGDGMRWLAGVTRRGERWSPGFTDPCAQVPTGENAAVAP